MTVVDAVGVEAAAEVQYLFILSRDLGYLAPEVTELLIAEAQAISRMPYALRSKDSKRRRPPRAEVSLQDISLADVWLLGPQLREFGFPSGFARGPEQR